MQQVLHLLFNVVWAQEQGPEEWDCALVRPLYKPKAKDPLLIENYRAVTLINTVCKLYEDTLCARVVHHLEDNRGLSPSQAGSRRFLGCTEMVYTLVTAARHRHASSKEGTYACFIDFRLAYPSTDQDVIFSKLHMKGITGRLWRNIRALYSKMRSRVIHPGIPADDYFDIEIGVREGSVLSPILFLVAVDDMREYLAARPFQHRGPSAKTKPGSPHQRFRKGGPPGIRIGNVSLAILQYVDDAVLLARSPEELQHMINVIAQYCSENRLTLNPKEGKTEVVEFLCAPSNTRYMVAAPTTDNPHLRAQIHVKKGYQYLGWWLDRQLLLDEHTDKIARLMTGAAARVVNMGGRPGGLPVRTTFQLWSSLALSHLHSTAALLSSTQIGRLQTKMDLSVRQLAGRRAEPAAVLADMGIPNAQTIHRIRLVSLLVRLRTLPAHLTPAALHNFLSSQVPEATADFEKKMRITAAAIGLGEISMEVKPPADSLGRPRHGEQDPITVARQRWATKIKKHAWETHRKGLLEGRAPFDTEKMRRYVRLAQHDLARTNLARCAKYLTMDLTANQEAAFLQLRTGGSLLAADQSGEDNPIHETDVRCDACILRNATDNDETFEDAQHALLHCCKRPHADKRVLWESQMAQAMQTAQVVRRHGQGRRGGTIQWSELYDTTKTKIALGVALPATWESLQRRNSRAVQELHEELIGTTAVYLPDLCKGLRKYHLMVLQSLEAGDPTYHAVQSLWDDAGNFSEPESEDEEMEVA